MRKTVILSLASIFVLSLAVADYADARGGRGGGGGMRGGGGASMRGGGGGGFGGGRSAATNIQRPSGGSFSGATARSGNFNGNFNNNRNVNANVNRNMNINVDNGWNGGCCGGGFAHPVAAAATVGLVAGATAAAIGSTAYALPPNCSPYGAYYNCGGTYYQPQYSGSDVTYVVVNNPG
jgi:hypothetical protein